MASYCLQSLPSLNTSRPHASLLSGKSGLFTASSPKLLAPEVRQKIVNTTILPKIEYCAAVWDPHLKQDIATLDSVQKFAGRMITGEWSLGIEELRSTLNWKSLKIRRRVMKLKIAYNINNLSRLSPLEFTNHPSPSPPPPSPLQQNSISAVYFYHLPSTLILM